MNIHDLIQVFKFARECSAFVYLVSQLLMEVIFGLSITCNKFSGR